MPGATEGWKIIEDPPEDLLDEIADDSSTLLSPINPLPNALPPVPYPWPADEVWAQPDLDEDPEDPVQLSYVPEPLELLWLVPTTSELLDEEDDPFDLSSVSQELSGLLGVPQLAPWLPSESGIEEWDLDEESLAGWSVDMLTILNAVNCVEWKQEGWTTPAFTTETSVLPTFKSEGWTLPTLTKESLC